ncbi:hypothetical protein DOM22_02770 [Bdellovibrio sp. ZAP7]|uniref:hypothetical protein n=1 Tax=Bdellovibrio sp. ZAP7 TaxID=2231053 RepID=UPI00115C315C|nr:hypothetical protein [Bdellovibrio sp. ZAP7]QDK44150.1 hypothetical protein DOM22_02770 [Bdellovibrio sp. ZAP7]
MRKMIVLVWVLQCLAGLAHATVIGVDSSGGGNELVGTFVSIADNVLDKVSFSSADRNLLKKALLSSRIVSVKTLTDAKGNAVPEQSQMLAYTYKGLIQLKEFKDGEDSWARAIAEKRSVAYIVIHELFRASGVTNREGRSIDDIYQLSVMIYRLNEVDNFGNLSEPTELHYWKCQCFEGENDSSPSAGLNLIDISSLLNAEKKAVSVCQKELSVKNSIARCQKFVGNPANN